MDISVEWTNPSGAVLAAAVLGLNMAAEHLLAASQELSPVDSGDNRRSAAVQEATVNDPVAWVTYGMPYSVRIHEATDMNFSTVKNPKAQAKFLETPLVRDRAELVGLIQASIRRVL